MALAVGSHNGDGGSGGSSGTWIDEGLGKGPVVGAIGIGSGCFLEVEIQSCAIGREAAIEIEGLGDVGERDGNS